MSFNIAVVGLGYVGLPLAVELGKRYPTVGFDTHKERVASLAEGNDVTLEITSAELATSKGLTFTASPADIASSNIYIVTVPTPIDKQNKPDLTPIREATKMVATALNKGDIVIYESTVYPGATEEVCVPLLEQLSRLEFNKDFFCGYSPERINPGDKEHRLTTIIKVTSGSTPEIAETIDALYREIIPAGTHKVSSIRVAEAAKVIENIQRDTNIALVNELALIFNRIGIDTEEVLEAAGSKWNFLPFRPGLVGGHCIGVDPYYLSHKAQALGYNPQLIAAARHINDNMGSFVVAEVVKLMAQKKIAISGSNILMMGLSFKENCPDLRNTRVVEMVEELQEFHANIDVFDPWVDPENVRKSYQLELIKEPKKNHYDAIIIAVSHQQFNALGANGIKAFGKEQYVLYDIKYLLKDSEVDGRL
ncbi:MAG: Vi polysaccharide biosynthesis protein VipA/TviB [Cycloclasticus sp. symbiont of Poecilosclerida sp. M]|nr:MAG: Vi polysaccharide biosynthesis protein VipA/TviB [Cycloclasticus sp. symbiont of Poecilosclerida sp. M]